MTKSHAIFLFVSTLLAVVNGATKVAVLEFGKNGSVRRTDSQNVKTSVEGVASFWNALHGNRNLQYPGMTVVPDLFQKPDSGVVIGISGNELKSMPSLSSLFGKSPKDVVGHMEIPSAGVNSLLSKVSDVEIVSAETLVDTSVKHMEKTGISGCSTRVTSENAVAVDATISAMLKQMKKAAEKSGVSVVVHIVVDEDIPVAHRRLEEEANNEAQDNNAANDENQKYFGYGYYNEFGEWVTPYKTMFQIQYFNVVLWTSLGLVGVLMFTIYMMLFMPLEPDTLLFGESAKVVGED